MRRISIFNEKGGVGKTTFTSLIACHLSNIGKKVVIMDFDHPTFHMSELHMRELDLIRSGRNTPINRYLSRNPQSLSNVLVVRVEPNGAGRFNPMEIMGVIEDLTKMGFEYIFYEFPGRMSASEPVSVLSTNGLVDKVLVPVDEDSQSRQSAMICCDFFAKAGLPLALFWNRDRSGRDEGDDRYAGAEEEFTSKGYRFLHSRVKQNDGLVRDGNTRFFFRSLHCFPQKYYDAYCKSIMPFIYEAEAFINE